MQKHRQQAAAVLFWLASITAAIYFVPLLAHADALSAYRNRNRVLIIFAQSAATPRYRRQMAIFAAASQFDYQDRDLVFVRCVGRNQPANENTALRVQYHVPVTAFRVLLIGKDGHVALSSAQPIAPADLFQTIDRMPMRREEMRQKGEL